MNERDWEIFFEIHGGLPREGPGDRASTARAFAMLADLPDRPRILDVGCGPGMQTLDLIKRTKGSIVATDNYQPFLDDLEKKAHDAGFAERIQVRQGDMNALDFADESFDVIWSEGAVYIMGLENGLKAWHRFLKPGGYIAVSEIAWLGNERPESVVEFFKAEGVTLLDIDENLKIVDEAGYKRIGHFTLPPSAWMDDYYLPLEKRLPALREKYKDDKQALGIVEMHQQEIDLFRKYSGTYSYVFLVMRK